MTERPELLKNEYMLYLDELHEKDKNLFRANEFLMEKFGISRALASQVFSYWMRTFSERHPLPTRD